jgi:ubiquitin C-terminal hydrolase
MSETFNTNDTQLQKRQKDRLGLMKQPVVITIDEEDGKDGKDNKDNKDEDLQIVVEPRTGLFNSGNDCFINSAIQCFAVSPFIHEFLKRYREDDNKMVFIINKYELGKLKADEMQEYIEKLLLDNKNIIEEEKRILTQISKKSGDIFIYTCFKELIINLHSRNYKNISCNTLMSVAKEITDSSGFEHLFSGEQNDPHELMAFLLDKMHNAKSTKVEIKLPGNYESMDSYSKLYLKHFKSRYENDFSMFVKSFYYYILNCIECNNCNHQSQDASPNDIMCVALPSNWQSNNNIRLEECIHEMFKVEDIDYKCEKCGNTEHNRMDKKLLTRPKTLIIKIKRYAQMGRMLVKVNKMVHYPETINLKEYLCGVGIQDYHLYGVINHIGSLGGGHYYSYIKDYNKDNQFENRWYLCNDTNVREIPFDDVMKSNNAYILFYHSNN